jgi:methyl-accepting chemotaxis protein
MKLKTKISLLIALPLIASLGIAIAVVLYGQQTLSQVTTKVTDEQMRREVSEQVRTLHALCDGQHTLTMRKLRKDATLAVELVKDAGSIKELPDERVSWQAVDQYTKRSRSVAMPKFMLGQEWFGQQGDFDSSVPLVDQVMKLTGSTCTVFQRMPDSNDFLRVATNVETNDGSRAIGTYLPGTMSDGKPNSVISTVLTGQEYEGMAYVVNAWYLTKYVPIRADGDVIGILYVGVKQDLGNLVRDAVRQMVVGKNGYAFVYSNHPSSQGVYTVAHDESFDGAMRWEVKDADDKYIVQNLISAAEDARADNGDGAAGFVSYRWQNEGEAEPREKIAAVVEFAPWNWVIGAGAYADNFQDGQVAIAGEMGDIVGHTITAGLITLVLAMIFAYLVLLAITRKISAIQQALGDLADGDLTVSVDARGNDEIANMAMSLNQTASGLNAIVTQIRDAADNTAASGEELSASAQNIATGAQTQASSTEEISASIQELSATVKEVASHAERANTTSSNTMNLAERGNTTVRQSVEGMNLINESAEQISKISAVIGQIANQTNLLALNAAIEAASAGEHGMGFAVVAEEVRKLAERAGTAAEEINQLIEESSRRVGEGMRLSEEVGKSLDEILGGIRETASGMSQITAGAADQALTAEQVATAVDGISAVTEENSSGAEEMAASAEELSAQAQRLQGLVERFKLSDNEAATQGPARIKQAAPVAPVAPRVTTAPSPMVAAKTRDNNAAASVKALYHE